MGRFKNEGSITSKFYGLVFLTISTFFFQTIQSSVLDERVLQYADDSLQDLIDRYEKSDSSDFWHPNSFKTGVQSREVVKISSVSKRTIPGNYKQWKYSQVGTGIIIAGLSSHWIDFYNEHLRLVATINTTETFVALATFSVWNERISKSELVVVVATEKPSLNSYILTNDSIVYPGSWPLHNMVKSLELCVVDMSRKIIVVPQDDRAPVDIYNFETRDDSSELWFFQRLNVGERTCLTVHEIQSSSCSIAVAESTKISVYQYESQLGLFYEQHQFKNISSTCKQLLSFSLAYSRYLGFIPLSRDQPVEFLSETGRDILYQHFSPIQAVEIVPLPVGDYRSEDVLLVRTPFNTTKIYSYDGLGKLFKETFVCTPDICSVYDNTAKGVGILVDGATVYFAPTQSGQDFATVLIIQSKIESYLSPLYERSRQLYDEFRSLSELYKRFKLTVAGVTSALDDSLSQSGNNVITGNWNVKDLSSSGVLIRDSSPDSNDTSEVIDQNFRNIKFMDAALTAEDFEVRDSETKSKVDQLQSLVQRAQLRASRTVPRNSPELVRITATQNIEANVQSAEIESEYLRTPVVNDVDRIQAFFSGLALSENPSGKVEILSKVKFNGKILANNLNAEKVNNITTSHFAYLSSKNVFNSTVAFHNNLEVLGHVSTPTVSGLHIPHDIILATHTQGVTLRDDLVALRTAEINEGIGSLKINREFADSIFLRDADQVINSDIQFAGIILKNNSNIVRLNDQHFTDTARSIVLRNHSGLIQGTKTVLSKKSSANSLTINEYLNSIPFPDGFLLAHENNATIFGYKNFSRISVDSVDLKGTINGAKTENMVRLNATQEPYLPFNWTLHGPVTFNGNVNVRQTVGEAKITDLYFTDTLDSSKRHYFPNHNIRFEFPVELEELNIEKRLNDKLFNESCGDILICENNADLVVRGHTTFESGGEFAQLNLKSNKVNGVPLDSILDRNTEQSITETLVFTQPINFEKLIALSEVDDVSLQSAFTDAILLNRDQVLRPDLHFESISAHAPVNVRGPINQFENFRNDVAVKRGRPEQVFESSLDIEDLEVHDLWATKNLVAFDVINGFNLSSWMRERVTLSGDATLYEPIEILGDTFLQKNVHTKILNGESLSFLNTKVLRKDKQEQRFVSPVVIYGSMLAQENAVIHKNLNGYNLEHVIRDSIPINSDQVENISAQWGIERPIFHNLTVHGTTCNVDVKVLDRDSVKEHQKNVTFLGATTIQGSLNAIERINTLRLNGIQFFLKIFTLHSPQVVNRNIIWKGDVTVDNLLQVQGPVNGVNLQELNRMYSYSNGTHKLLSDVKFESTFHANNFVVSGLIQQENFAEFLRSSVRLNSSEVQTMQGNIKFTQPIVSEGNVNCQTINGVDVSRLANSVIRKNSEFKFTKRVCFDETLTVESLVVNSGNVSTTSNIVNEIDFRELKTNSIPLFSPYPEFLHSLSFKDVLIEGNLDGVQGVNRIQMEDFLTRNTHQSMKSLRVNNLTLLQNGIAIQGLFGNINIIDEFTNTLMTSEQVGAVKGAKTFTTVSVEGDLTTGGKNILSELVNMGEDNNVTSKTSFTDLFIVTGDVTMKGQWNGYSLEDLNQNGLSSYGDDVISADWTFRGGVVFRNTTNMSGLIDGVNITQLDAESKFKVMEAETNIEKEELVFSQVCQTLQTLYEDAARSPLKLQSFDEQQVLMLQGKVENMLTIRVRDDIFLLIASDACGALVYHWSTRSELFYESGFILPTESILKWSQASEIDSAVLVFYSGSSKCDPLSLSGLYYTYGNADRNFSSKSLINRGAVLDFKLATYFSYSDTNTITPLTLLFAVFEESAEVINVFSWSRNTESFTAETTINITSSITAFDVNELDNGNFAVLLKTRSQISIHIYSSLKRRLTKLSHVEIHGSAKILKFFQADSSLFALVSTQTQEFKNSIVKPYSNLQLLEATGGELRRIQEIQMYDPVTVEVVRINTQVFVLVLTKPVGLYVYKYMGLSGLQSINDHPLKFQNGEILNAFYVTPWHYNTTLPFVLVSSRNVIKLLHSNVIGNAVLDPSMQVQVDHMCDFGTL